MQSPLKQKAVKILAIAAFIAVAAPCGPAVNADNSTVTMECPGEHIRRWFIADEFGPLILREDGRQKRGAYSRRAISMDLERAVAE